MDLKDIEKYQRLVETIDEKWGMYYREETANAVIVAAILSEMRKDERLAESKKQAWPIPNTQTPPKPETPKPQFTQCAAQPPIPMTENQIKYCKANGLNYSGWDFDRAYREIGNHKREMGLR